MNNKPFVIQESEKGTFETMPKENVAKYLKQDGYDHLREKIYYGNILEREYEVSLIDVERTIAKLKEAEKPQNVTTNYFKEVLEDRIIILPDLAESMTGGGVYIPEAQQNIPARGTVIKVGPGMPSKMHHKLTGYVVNGTFKETVETGESGEALYSLLAMPLKEGMRVLYSKQAGLKITDPDIKKDFLVMRVTDVWIVL